MSKWIDVNQRFRGAESQGASAESEPLHVGEDGKEDLEAVLAERTKERDAAEAARKRTQMWYATRYERMHQWMRENASDEAQHEYFSIVANGTKDVSEAPTYATILNVLTYRAEKAEAECNKVFTAGVEAMRERALSLLHEWGVRTELLEGIRVAKVEAKK
jgi:hypothetical protein